MGAPICVPCETRDDSLSGRGGLLRTKSRSGGFAVVQKPTIREIAKLAGVSVSTVSRVLNNRADVNACTRGKVLTAIEEAQYIPNLNAKQLKQLSCDCVAVILRGMNNVFFSGLMEELQRRIEQTGLTFLPYYIDENADEIAAAQQVYAERKVQGIIFMGGYHEGRAEVLAGLPVPCVFSTVNAEGCRAPNISSVCVDDRQGARLAADYLLDRGHREILILGADPENSSTAKLRLQGLRESFEAHGLPFRAERYLTGSFSFEDARRKVENYRGRDYTAVLAMSDTMAIGAMRALWAIGRRVPKDVSVVGFDGIDIAGYTVPPLTTVRQPRDLLAQASIELLTAGRNGPGRHIRLEAELVEGASVKRLD